MSSVCPICSVPLVTERLQFRQDDEPATLVVACPAHGSIGQTISRYRNQSITGTLNCIQSVRSDQIAPMNTGHLHGIIKVSLQHTVYCLDTIVIGKCMDMDSIYYGTSNVMCTANGNIFHALRSTYDPMWINSIDNKEDQNTVVYTINNISEEIDYHIQLYKIDMYKQCMDQELYNGIIVHVSYKVFRDIENRVNVIIKSITNPDRDEDIDRHKLSVQYVSDPTDTIPMDNLMASMKKIMTLGILKGYEMMADINKQQNKWYYNILHISRRSCLCSIYITRHMIRDTADGMFLCSKGRHGYWYIHRQMCYRINIKQGTLQCLDVCSIKTDTYYALVLTGYMVDNTDYIEVSMCTDTRTWSKANMLVWDNIMKYRDHFRELETGSFDNWRIFVPANIKSMVQFHNVPSKHESYTEHPNVLHCILASGLYAFMRDTSQDIVFMLGKPRAEYRHLRYDTRLCWIYDCDWDEEGIDDYTAYKNVDHAVSMCIRGQNNICGSDTWWQHIMCHDNILLCVLEDSLLNTYYDDLEHSSLNKFIVCVNQHNHRNIDFNTGIYTINIRDTIVDAVANNLVDHYNDYCDFILVSESMMPYISTRLLIQYQLF